MGRAKEQLRRWLHQRELIKLAADDETGG